MEAIITDEIKPEHLENYRVDKFDEYIPDELARKSYLSDRVNVDEAREAAKQTLRSMQA